MPRQKRKLGFNMIELAIVLAIVGAVMGGIYVAASSVYEKRKQTELYNQVMTTAKNVRDSWSTKKGFPTSFSSWWATHYNLFPASILLSGSGEYIHAYGGGIRIMNLSAVPSWGVTTDQEFAIIMRGIPKPSCVVLLMNFASPQALNAAGITRIGSRYRGQMPNLDQGITITKANNYCAVADWDDFVIAFSIRN